MCPGSPPPARFPRENRAAGPSEELSLGETGLIGLPPVEIPLTFRPGPHGRPVAAWEEWTTRIFAPILAPALLEAARLADQDRTRDLRAADLRLAAQLDPSGAPDGVTRGVREEGPRLLVHLHGARSARWVSRFETWAASGETPALFPTVFAARAALFHLPPRPMLFGYALLEWRAAARCDQPPCPVGLTPEAALALVRPTIADLLRPTLAAA